jgi:dTDP-4-amino-4,6-dideoxygalactose transaminase
MNKTIPICKPSLPPLPEYKKTLNQIWETKMLSNFSTFSKKMGKIISKQLENQEVIVVSNGDIGLITALQSLLLPKKSEIILPSFTFNSTANSVLWNNLKPVFADIREDTFCLDPDDVEKKVGPETRAILATHIFGNPCNIDQLSKIADDNGLHLIFDAAHAYGSKYQNKKIGTFPNLEVFSFSGTKIITSAEGGAITCSDPKIIERVKHIRNYGFIKNYKSKFLGINGKISELNAALGYLLIPYLDKFLKKRNLIAQKYHQLLKPISKLKFQVVKRNNYSCYQHFCILTNERDKLSNYLSTQKIQTKKYFRPLHLMPFFKNKQTLPTTELIASQVLCLPIYNDMTMKEVEFVCQKIKLFYNTKT